MMVCRLTTLKSPNDGVQAIFKVFVTRRMAPYKCALT
jgi:hypothetical protein